MDRSEFPPCCSGVKEPISVEYSSLGPPVFPSMTLGVSPADALVKAINLALKYLPPSRARLTRELLEECLDDVVAKVRVIVDAKR